MRAPKSNYEHFLAKNAQILDQFILQANFDRKGESKSEQLKLIKPPKTSFGSRIADAVGKTESIIYEFNNAPVNNVLILKENNSFYSTIWKTTPESIIIALCNGVFDPKAIESPIAKIIAIYGKYKKITIDRDRSHKIVGNRHQDKLTIINFAQQSLLELLKLQNLINNYQEDKTPNENKNLIIQILENFIKLPQQENGKILDDGRQKIINSARGLIEYVKKLSDNSSAIKEFLRPYAGPALDDKPNNLFHFIQDQIEIINQTARKANNAISPFYNRGEFFHCIIDAETATRKMSERVDYHNAIPAEWNFIFKAHANEELIFDFRKFGVQAKNKNELDLQFQLLKLASNAEKLTSNEHRLSTSWAPIKKTSEVAYSFGRFFAGTLDLILACTVIYPILAHIDIVTYPSEAFEDYVEKRQNKFKAQSRHATHFVHRAPIRDVLTFFRRQIKKLSFDLLRGFGVAIKNVGYHGFKIRYHQKIGSKSIDHISVLTILEKNAVNSECREKLFDHDAKKFIENYNKTAEKKVSSHDEYSKKNQSSQESSKKILCQMPHGVDFDNPNDVLSGAASGYQILFEVFLDEIYRKHPVGGMAFTAFASMGGLPMYLAALPAHFSFLNTYLHKVSMPIAQCLIGHTEGFMPAFSTALIQGKVAFLVLDCLEKGPKSLLKEFLQEALENPALTAAALTFAIGTGYLVAFKLSIPFISPELAEDAEGSFPYVELAFAGAKLAAILAEGLIEPSDPNYVAIQSDKERYEQRIREAFSKIYQASPTRSNQTETDIENAVKIYIANLKTGTFAQEFSELDRQLELIRNSENLKKHMVAQQNINTQNLEFENLTKEIRTSVDLSHFRTKKSRATTIQPSHDFAKKIEEQFTQQIIRERINRMNINLLTYEEKYILLHWVQENYPHEINYIRALKGRLYSEKRLSPLATSIITLLERAIEIFIALLVTLPPGLFFAYVVTQDYGKFLKKIWVDLGEKISADIGLIVRSTGLILKYTFLMAAEIIKSAVSFVLLIITLPLIGIEIFCRESYRKYEKPIKAGVWVLIVIAPILAILGIFSDYLVGVRRFFKKRDINDYKIIGFFSLIGLSVFPVFLVYRAVNGFRNNAVKTFALLMYKNIIHSAKTLANFVTREKFFTRLFEWVTAKLRNPIKHKNLFRAESDLQNKEALKNFKNIKIIRQSLTLKQEIKGSVPAHPERFSFLEVMRAHSILSKNAPTQELKPGVYCSQRVADYAKNIFQKIFTYNRTFFSSSLGATKTLHAQRFHAFNVNLPFQDLIKLIEDGIDQTRNKRREFKKAPGVFEKQLSDCLIELLREIQKDGTINIPEKLYCKKEIMRLFTKNEKLLDFDHAEVIDNNLLLNTPVAG